MTRTARVAASEPVSDILREGTRLKVSESGRRRVARRFALYDLRRWCVRHAIAVLAGVCLTGSPVAFGHPVSGAPLARPMTGRPCTRETRAFGAPALGCTAVYGLCTEVYGFCTAVYGFLYGDVRYFMRWRTVIGCPPSHLGKAHPNGRVTQNMTNTFPANRSEK